MVKLLDCYSSSFHLLEEAFKLDKKRHFVEPFFEMIKSRHHNAREEYRLGEMKAKEVIEIDPVLAIGWALLAEALAGQNECKLKSGLPFYDRDFYFQYMIHFQNV